MGVIDQLEAQLEELESLAESMLLSGEAVIRYVSYQSDSLGWNTVCEHEYSPEYEELTSRIQILKNQINDLYKLQDLLLCPTTFK